MNRLENTFAYKIRSLRKIVLNDINEIFAGTQLTWELYFALRYIYEHPGCSQKEIADFLWTDANIIVRNVDKMSRMGLVKRKRHPSDRRAYALRLTEEGEKISVSYWEKIIERQENTLQKLSTEERQNFRRYVDTVIGESHPYASAEQNK